MSAYVTEQSESSNRGLMASASPSPQGLNTFELIPHRVFVGGFPPATVEAELRSFFERHGSVREVKIIRSPEGNPKGYGFVTFETEAEAARVRQQSAENLEFKGRRLNVGPAMRRISQTTRVSDLSVATPQMLLSPSPSFAAYPGGFTLLQDPSLVSQNQIQGAPTYALVIPSPQPSAYPSFQFNTVGTPQTQNPRFVVPTLNGGGMETEAMGGRAESVSGNDTLYSSMAPAQPLTPITPVTHQTAFRWSNMAAVPYQANPTPLYQHHQYQTYYANPMDMTHYSQMYPTSPHHHWDGIGPGDMTPETKKSNRNPVKSLGGLGAQMSQLTIQQSAFATSGGEEKECSEAAVLPTPTPPLTPVDYSNFYQQR